MDGQGRSHDPCHQSHIHKISIYLTLFHSTPHPHPTHAPTHTNANLSIHNVNIPFISPVNESMRVLCFCPRNTYCTYDKQTCVHLSVRF